MKMKKLGLLLMLLCASFAMHAQELKKGDKLPDFQLKSSVYGDVSSADLKGKVGPMPVGTCRSTKDALA